jgi:CubicO group peptidase (beta-lactamase class C family)
MASQGLIQKKSLKIFTGILLILLLILTACASRPSDEELEAVDYTPLVGNDWQVSNPVEQDLDAMSVAELYFHAAELETIYGLLVVKNGYLIAEDYFNGATISDTCLLQSVSKSIVSTLIGIALKNDILPEVEAKMLDYFPAYADSVTDSRKQEITLRDMLQMRSGYPDEETAQVYLDALYWGEYLPLIENFPLVNDPGAAYNYCNLNYNLLGILLADECGMDLKAYAQEHLFEAIDTKLGPWLKDRDGNYLGCGGIHLRTRDAAKYGMLNLNKGVFDGEQVISTEWINASMQNYSPKARQNALGLSFRDFGYGYGWWIARAGEHTFRFAWGHGGQFIVLLEELDMIIVTTAYPFYGEHGSDSWTHEKAIMNLVGDFIKSLPGE